MTPLDSAILLFGSPGLWAYGAAPGLELIPYFLALVAWVVMAFVGVIVWPLTSLLQRLRGRRNAPAATCPTEPAVDNGAAPGTSGSPDPKPGLP